MYAVVEYRLLTLFCVGQVKQATCIYTAIRDYLLSKDISDDCRRHLPLVSRESHSLRRLTTSKSFLPSQLQQGSATARWHGHSHGCLLDKEESEKQRALRQQVSAEDIKAADRITWVGVWHNVALSGE